MTSPVLRLIVAVAGLSVGLGLGSTGVTAAGGTCAVAVSPSTVVAGDSVAVSASGFGAAVTTYVNGPLFGGSVQASATGDFSRGYRIAAPMQPGTYVVDVRDPTTGGCDATAQLTVTAPQVTITLNKTTLIGGDTLTITGTGFLPGELLSPTGPWQSNLMPLADASGGLSASFSIGPDVPAGSYIVDVSGTVSARHVSTTLTVLAPTPGLTVSTATVPEGGSVVVTGSGYLPGEQVNVKGPVFAQGIADQNGGFTTQPLGVPPSTVPGTYTLAGHGGSSGRFAALSLTVLGPSAPTQASFTLTPNVAQAGSPVSISGTGFTPGDTVTFSYRKTVSVTTVADGTGKVNTILPLPYSEAAVTMPVYAVGLTTRAGANEPLQVTHPVTAIVVPNGVIWPGTPITLSGTGFLPNEQIGVSGLWTTTDPTTTADANGAFATTLVVGQSAPNGGREVIARGRTSGWAGIGRVNMLGQTPALGLPTTPQRGGATFTVTGAGFLSGEAVSMTGFWAPAKTVTADASGGFSTTVTLNTQPPNGNLAMRWTGATSGWQAMGPLTADNTPPSLTNVSAVPATFSPALRQSTLISYTLSESAQMRCSVLDATGAVVQVLSADTVARPAGSYSCTWFGHNADGTSAADGSYTYKLEAADLAGNVGIATGTVTVDSTPPALTNLSATPNPFTPNGDGINDVTSISYSVNESSTVGVQVVSATGDLVRILQNPVSQSSGNYSVTWDGKLNTGAVAPLGVYTYRVNATDAAGNSGTVQGTVTLSQ
jgi:flagellar hook assembly protein FlgD